MHTAGFRQLTKVEDAMRIFFEAVGNMKISVESILIQDAVGRILAREAIARSYLPPTDLSALDGYAVRSNDLRDASQSNRVVLRIVGESRLGEPCQLRIASGQAVVVATGSCMPGGADAVVMVEHTSRHENLIEVTSAAALGQGVTEKGSDFAPGRQVVRKGRRLRPEDIGALKALGLSKVLVARRIRVGVLSTGNELVNSQRTHVGAKVVDVNRPIISAMLKELGAEPVDLGIVRDEPREIRQALLKGLRASDVVLVTAGSSVGKKDLVPSCINSLGRPGMLVHGIAMRPAMPTGLAVVNRKPIVSLPGFPVSAIVAFKTIVRPLLAKLSGFPMPVERSIRAILKERISGAPNLRTFVRVRVEKVQAGFLASPLNVQRSSVLTSMVDANGIVTIPESVGSIEAGEEVDVSLTSDI
ncbi:MAG: gephyrin-like molybdotransferase Glp [Candidatus Bathyarchaeia archaeon]